MDLLVLYGVMNEGTINVLGMLLALNLSTSMLTHLLRTLLRNV